MQHIYYLDKRPGPDGYQLVHTARCVECPPEEKRIYLGGLRTVLKQLLKPEACVCSAAGVNKRRTRSGRHSGLVHLGWCPRPHEKLRLHSGTEVIYGRSHIRNE